MASLYSQQFIRAVNFTLDPSIEGAGKVSQDPKDPGNWTGGAAGKGELKGTKWGISAAAYPTIDIPSLSRESAVAIYYKDYWCPIRGDQFAPRLAMCIFDAAVNEGVGTAVKLLQQALRMTPVDGEIGPQTVAAAKQVDQDYLIQAFLAERGFRYAQTRGFQNDGRGWLRRCFSLCAAATR